MGIGLWLGCGFAAAIVARIVPTPAPRGVASDAIVGVVTSLIAGAVATALDFGGWNEPDWRAGVFAFASALAVIGWMRAIVALRRRRA